ncbi:MAG: hypothetical protein ACQSGP_26640 [Frankia sp.]
MGFGVLTLAVASFAAPAQAATTGDTAAQFEVGVGALSISVPGEADFGQVASNATTLTAPLGTVTVADQRAALNATWTATVSSTSFTTGGATPSETISNADVAYWSGPATAATGTATRVPGQLTAAAAVALNATRTAFSATAIIGNNTTEWDPTVVIALPGALVAGTYTGTITHSVG